MGDNENYVTKFECVTQQREMDTKINDLAEELRKDYRAEVAKVYAKIDRLFWAGVAVVITSLVSICLTLFTLWAGKH